MPWVSDNEDSTIFCIWTTTTTMAKSSNCSHFCLSFYYHRISFVFSFFFLFGDFFSILVNILFIHGKKMQPFLNITFCLLLFHFPGFYSSLDQTAVLSVDKLKSSKRKLFYRNWNEIVPSICGVWIKFRLKLEEAENGWMHDKTKTLKHALYSLV